MINKWFEDFEKELSSLSFEEGKKAVEYYRELYQDKIDAGLSAEEILASFGSPTEAAKAILENSSEKEKNDFTEEGAASANPYIKDANGKTESLDGDKITRNQVLGIVATVLVAVALGSVALSLITLMLRVELALMTSGLSLVFHLPTLAAGLIFIGLLLVLLFPFIKFSIFLVNSAVKVSKRVYFSYFRREQA